MKGKYRNWNHVLKHNYDFDYAFMLEIEKHKLKNMLKYFKKSNIREDNAIVIRDLKLAIYLLDIILKEDYKHRVNIKNGLRFVNLNELTFIKRFPEYIYDVAVAKAWCLYHKLRYYRMRNWWD